MLLRPAYLLVLTFIVPSLATDALFGQEPVAADSPESFDEVHSQWDTVDSQLDELIKSYRAADASEREKLRKQYDVLIAQSRKLLPKLRQTAVAQYQAEPNQNDRVTKTLVGLLASDVQQDKYEGALQLAGMLLKNDCSEPGVLSFAGMAAYSIDDFVLAETHLKKAEAAGSLMQQAQAALADLPTAKETWTREQEIRAQEAKVGDLPRVKMETSKGTVVIELYENEAPKAVGNFVSLVESGYYDGLTFHRVLPGFMAQGGCPDGTGSGGPGYNIPCECHQDNYRRHFRGSLSMAHAGRDTGGSQFFLTFKRTAHLDGRHTVFGRVVEGLDVLAALQRRNPQQGGQPEPDRIVKAEVVRKRDHEYKPTKVQ
ncbi:MAG: peptidylprolyl isomerase [Fuerstiella sp.]|jgi:cyclophilin family peptidyl-prolyl cis-trans isomerase|nr:peptidylprolyl isomerase [Fuerstiella sp.]